jgi:hypothetical protein
MQTTTTPEQDAQLRERQQQMMQAEQQRVQEGKQDYQQQTERRRALTDLTLRVTESQTPTPTQEENDLAKLGLLHPDEKEDPNNPEMPPLHVQQAYLETGENKPEPVTQQQPQQPGRPALAQSLGQPRRPNEPPPERTPLAAERSVPRGERS